MQLRCWRMQRPGRVWKVGWFSVRLLHPYTRSLPSTFTLQLEERATGKVSYFFKLLNTASTADGLSSTFPVVRLHCQTALPPLNTSHTQSKEPCKLNDGLCIRPPHTNIPPARLRLSNPAENAHRQCPSPRSTTNATRLGAREADRASWNVHLRPHPSCDQGKVKSALAHYSRHSDEGA